MKGSPIASNTTTPASLPLSLRQKVNYVFSLWGTLTYELASRASPDPENRFFHYDIIRKGKSNEGALILGAQPIATKFEHFGNHGDKILSLCQKNKKPLGAVFSVLTEFEMQGRGLEGIKPVSAKFWTDHGVNHHLIQMQDLSDNIDLDYFKKEIDAADEMIKQGRSVYVHCKAGCGRSFTFVMCYLISHTDLSPNDALNLIFEKRPQIYPTASQLALIENFRKKFCANKPALNLSFHPLANNLLIVAKNPLLHGLVFALIALLACHSLLIAGAIGLIVGATSWVGQDVRHHLRDNAYKALVQSREKNTLEAEFAKFPTAKLKALNDGIESEESWAKWGAHLTSPEACSYYATYLAGQRAKCENDPLCEVASNTLKKKIKL